MEKRIIRIVSDHFGVSEEDIKGESRQGIIVQSRHYAMVMLRNNGYSYHYIGRLLNKKHDTVMSAVKKIENRMSLYSYDKAISDTIKDKIAWNEVIDDIFMENDFFENEPEKVFKYSSPFSHLASRSTHYQEYIR